MSALNHSPFEALAFDYLRCGFLTAVNSVWIAVITAALSFWRIRALSSPLVSTPEPRGSIQDAVSTSEEKVGHASASASTPGETKHLLSAGATTWCGVAEREGSSKVKFSLCYNEDIFRGSYEDEDDGGCNGGGAAVTMSGKIGWWCDDVWERTTVVRMGDMGWYRCQDLAALDGSVVRLWGGRRRRAATGGGAFKW
ncbi:uncharacterized protein LOC105162007 [Sesamum indicum]|uniref:Uncharacterized protein LOC105162007 n=1 Tax=Sesamum indicum TaxID=4182 RepID=A0A6I9TC91_SESIN|nr:uncharacterized protein LOC105162007 [Sesamum indicum]